ncbi:MAG TPA: sialidase family protein [Steroidobacteraceae bacterium]|nr:sialidase family protein [Steroidobacteraceae bacterium]
MSRQRLHPACPAAAVALGLTLGSCGGSDGNLGPGGGPPPYTAVPQVQVSQPSALAPNCDGESAAGTLYTNTAIEPQVAVSPFSSTNLIAAWQQNRWSTGGAQVIGVAASLDGGNSWTLSSAPFFSRCAGGNSGNAGNYARASNPWVTISPNGYAYVLALAFTGDVLAAGSSSGMLVSQSIDGGQTWSLPVALIQDGADFFNDKGSITADPGDSNFVYVVWDRLTTLNTGPAYFTLTANGNSTWAPARAIYDPGTNNQTINNILVVTADGRLVDLFNEIDTASDGTATSHLKAISSTDKGTTWSTTPVSVADMLGVGTVDPNGGHVRDSQLLFSAAVGPTGTIYVVWQDARFSDGDHDGVAFSYSTDDGDTWSAPVEVNGDPSAAAFTPTINVSAAGLIGITYYDLRNAHYLDTGLLTDAWIVTSADGKTFTELHLSGPFDLQLAPLTTAGYFLGDYQSLLNNGTNFEPFYAQPNSAPGVSTDVSMWFPTNAPASSAASVAAQVAYAPRPAVGGAPGAALRQLMSARIHAALAQRYGGG